MPEQKIKKPLLSVIVPICNVEKYLAECLESIVNQTVEDIEIVCINDGSTDGSLEILLDFADRDSRIVVIDKPNAGYGAAMNDGLDKATGEYITILESDDFVAKHSWEQLLEKARNYDLDIIKGCYWRHSDEDEFFPVHEHVDAQCPDWIAKIPTDVVFDPRDCLRVYWMTPSIWSCVYRRSFIEDNRIRFNETPGASFQDAGFFFEVWTCAKRAMMVELPVMHYRIDNSGSSSKSTKKVFTVKEEMDFIQEFLDKRNAPQIVQEVLCAIRFKTYIWNTKRIADEYVPEFEKAMAEDFLKDFQHGHFSPLLFRPKGRKKFLDYVALEAESNGVEVDISQRASKDSPFISLVIPVHNNADYLHECLDSVTNQTYGDFEAICVDDGSTDNSYEILCEYAAKDSRFVILQQEKSNAGIARNRALEIARGEYLAFLDSDDYFDTQMFEYMAGAAYTNKLDIALCKSFYLNDRTKEVTDHNKPVLSNLEPRIVYSADELWGYAFRYAVGWPWDKLYRRAFIEENSLLFQELQSTNDAYFVFMSLALAVRFMYMDNRLVYHRIKNLRSIENNRDKSFKCLFEAIDKIYANFDKRDLPYTAMRDLNNWIAEMCLWNFKTLKESRKDFFESAKSKYMNRLSQFSKAYFYDTDYCMLVRSWSECSYETFEDIFNFNEERKTSRVRANKAEAATRKLRKQKESVEKQRDKARKERDAAKREINRLKKSISWKAGRALTLIPRKLKR